MYEGAADTKTGEPLSMSHSMAFATVRDILRLERRGEDGEEYRFKERDGTSVYFKVPMRRNRV